MSAVLIYKKDGSQAVFWPADQKPETIDLAIRKIFQQGGTEIQRTDSSLIPPEILVPPAPTKEMLEDRARARFDADSLFKAKCISDLAFRLGKAPGQLTPTELNTERDRIAAIFGAMQQ